MAGWFPLPSSLQKRFLSYALARTGIFDETVLDLDKLNLTWGRQNVVELHNVALSIPGISKLVDLPPELRLTAAKALSLRLTVPADILHSNIVFDLDGINVDAVHEQRGGQPEKEKPRNERRSQHVQSPAHRKTTRRIPSPYGEGRGGTRGLDTAAQAPTVHDMARSFLLEKSPEERQMLEESVAVHAQPLDESMSSVASDVSAVGTGAVFGLPGFLEAFLRGVMDRVKINSKNISVLLTINGSKLTAGLHLSINEIRVWSEPVSVAAPTEKTTSPPPSADRRLDVVGVTLELLHDRDLLSSMCMHDDAVRSPRSARSTPRSRKSPSSKAPSTTTSAAPLEQSGSMDIATSDHNMSHRESHSSPVTARSQDSMLTTEAERFADVDDNEGQESQLLYSELDIRPGEDNISWGSRKTHTGARSQDMWDTAADDDDLPDSLLFDSRPAFAQPRTHRPTLGHDDELPPVSQLQASSIADDVFADPPSTSIIRGGENGSSIWIPANDGHTGGPTFDDAASNAASVDPSPNAASSTMESEVRSDHPGAIVASDVHPPHRSIDQPNFSSPAQSQTIGSDGGTSMYMSTFMHESPKTGTKSRLDMPGAWASELHDSSVAVSSTPVHSRPSEPQAAALTPQVIQTIDELPTEERSGANTPRAASPNITPLNLSAPPRHSFGMTTELLKLDHMLLSLHFAPQSLPSDSSEDYSRAKDRSRSIVSLDAASSQTSRPDSQVSHGSSELINTAGMSMIVKVDSLKTEIDVPTMQILHAVSAIVATSTKPASDTSRNQSEKSATTTSFDARVEIQQINLKVHPELHSERTRSSVESLNPSIELCFYSPVVRLAPSRTTISVSRVLLLNNSKSVLSFQKEQSSDTIEHGLSYPDLEITYSTSKTDTRGRVVPEIDLKTQILRLNLDANELADVSSNWGGLSGLLDIRTSISSEGNAHFAPPALKKHNSGVHFEGDVHPSADNIETKVNVRVAGCIVDVKSQTIGITLRTTSIRIIHREQASSASTSQIRLEMPVSTSSSTSNIVTLDNVRFDLLGTPQDKDLERFLALLTPSKDKYENDEDILLDTLLRQRKKGSCLRVTADTFDILITDWSGVLNLQSLPSEFGQLSAVAKYLPDDDRPGLLSMVRIKEMRCQLPTGKRLGVLRLASSELQCAHVGIPALLACSLTDLSLRTSTGSALLHPLLPLVGSENLPSVMVRMVGDDFDPTVQIKLHNICADYTVPTLLDVLDEPAAITGSQVLEDLSQSIADMALSFPQHLAASKQNDVASSEKEKQRFRLSILIRNSGIGLQPQKLSAKAIFVLTDMKVSTLAPPDPTVKLNVGIRRAGLFVIDEIPTMSDHQVPISRRPVSNTATDSRIVHALSKQGYVSVGSIMSANVDIVIHDSVEDEPRRTEVDVRNELLLLETCADSTQTLFAILGDLAPPSPPSTQAKYLTQPMSLEQMLASFTGEPIVKAERNEPETLFDADADLESDNELFLEASEVINNADDLLLESEMTSSLYGPVSGLIGDAYEETEETRPPTEAAESLLEEDPFVMTVTPDDLPFSDTTLLKDLRQQCQPTVTDEAVDLGSYEIEDLGFEALGPEMQVLGPRNRFAAPIPQPGKSKQRTVSDQITLCIRLRDTNFIWNIHDGYDWQKTQDGITSAVEQIELRAEERLAKRRTSRPDQDDDESVIGDFLFNSIYIGIPSNVEAQDIRRQINRHIDDLASETESIPMSGRSRPTVFSGNDRAYRPRRRLKLDRSRSHKIAFELKGLFVDFNALPPDSPEEVQSTVDIRIKSFEIFDNVPTSTWRKFLTQLPPSDGTRELSRPMMHLELSNVRTIQDHAATEMILNVTIMPLRLHVDQDALDFVTRFFEFKDESVKSTETAKDQPFLQRVEVQTVDLCLDYKPKKVDYAGLRSGHTTEFMNFVILDAANIKLKHAIVYGIKGFEPLHKTLNDVWMPDVRRNQLPTVLAGLAPVRSLVNIGSGVRDVVAIPIREYKKDGRIVRSIQKGAFHFGKTTASELARLGAKVAIGTQNMLQGAEGLLSPSPARSRPSSRQVSYEQGWHDSDIEDDTKEPRAISAYADQPLGVLAGLQSARRFLEHDLLTARDAFLAVQGEVLNSDNPGAAAAAIARHAPTVILRPVIGASRAVGTALLGVGNQIDRENLTRMDDKYKRR